MRNEDVARGLAQRLRDARMSTGLTQAQVESKVGLGSKTVTNWESKDGQGFGSKGPTLFQIQALAEFYEVSIDWLLGRTEVMRPLVAGDLILDLDVCDKILDQGPQSVTGSAYFCQIPVRWRQCKVGDSYLASVDAVLARGQQTLNGKV